MQYGTIQVDLPPALISMVRDFGNAIPKDFLAGKGLDTGTPHITLFYGLEDENYKPLQDVTSRYFPFYVTLGQTSSFPPSPQSDNAAVLIVTVRTQDMLRSINRAIKQSGMNLRPYDFDYKAHITIAYMKPETVKPYEGNSYFDGQQFMASEMTVLNKDKRVTTFRPGKTNG